MHKQANDFIERMLHSYPDAFKAQRVLDCGSLDLNGNNRKYFSQGSYHGIDVGPGRNVDQVESIYAHLSGPDLGYTFLMCTEVMEHNATWIVDWELMNYMARKNKGSILMTCAGPDREEHGTHRTSPGLSPFTNDYYHNRHLIDFKILPGYSTLVQEYGIWRGKKMDVYIFVNYNEESIQKHKNR
jgi:hypothetical protein